MKSTRKYSGIAFALVLLVTMLILSGSVLVTRAAGVLYVNDDATGLNNGSSWANAYTDLQSALSAATSGDEIWVAEGVYKPGTARTDSFTLVAGVGLYGGFDGTETSRGQRDWENNVTTLSGDIAGDNVYHVVYYGGLSDDSWILDGFTVTAGQADGSGENANGGGMYDRFSNSPRLANVIFSGNSAGSNGGGIYNYCSRIILTNATFSGNSASNGGGIYNYNSSRIILTNVTFSGNSASNGGGMYNYDGSSSMLTNVIFSENSASNGGGMYNYCSNSLMLTNVTFSGNTASSNGGGMYSCSQSSISIAPILTNCVLWGNSAPSGPEVYNYNNPAVTVTYSNIQGGYSGTGNIDADPLFVDAASGDLRLTAGSPCNDAGTSSGAPSTDIVGVARPWDSGYDMGAYEYAIGVDVSPGTTQTTGYAHPITFTHTITNTGSQSDTFNVAAIGDWLTGREPASVTLGAMEKSVISLYAQVSGTPTSGMVGSLVVTVTSQLNSAYYDTATDTVIFQLSAGDDSDGDGIPDATEGDADPDNDGIPNYLDTDSDGDGIPDATEGDADPDNDGIPNYLDTDSDGDGIPDATEGTGDPDNDGILNYLDTDSDGDGIPDSFEGAADTDSDGIPNYLDDDSDGDGIPDSIEGAADPDNDGIPNYQDTDSDGDGKLDATESTGDDDGDGIPNYIDTDDADGPDGDTDGDGISNSVEGAVDTDGDGIPDYLDLDSDGDGILDSVEGTTDTDGDGIPDRIESNGRDTDGDGLFDYQDTDSDGDGIPDGTEGTGDADGDGIPDYLDADNNGQVGANGGDSDGDGIPDGVEAPSNPPIDTDGDGIPDYMDLDSDGDGIPDSEEGDGDDDGDGVPNYRDPFYFVYLPLTTRAHSTGPVTHDLTDAPNDCPGQPVVIGDLYLEDFDQNNDNDWYSFEAVGGEIYTIQTSDLEANADTIMVLYAPDCTTRLAENDDISYPDDIASRIVWTAPADGSYCALVSSYDWRVYGTDTGYTFSVSPAAAAASAASAAEDIAAAAEKPAPLPTPSPRRAPGLQSPLPQKPTPPPTPMGEAKPAPPPTPQTQEEPALAQAQPAQQRPLLPATGGSRVGLLLLALLMLVGGLVLIGKVAMKALDAGDVL